MLTSEKARQAFDLSRESDSINQMFGNDGFSASCLLAARLVEAGVRFVTVSSGMQQASKELMAQVQPHPLIQQHIGQVQSMSMNFGESVALNEGKVGKKTAVFDIKGSQGSALIAGQVDDGHDRPARFQGTTVLILPSGESHELQF